MSFVKTSISLPEDVIVEARKQTDNLSSLVTDALREYLRKRHVEKAAGSFGAWKDRKGTSADMVIELRKDAGRKYADRTI
jgi:hypothetical protein